MKELLRHLPYYLLVGLMVFIFLDKCSSDYNPLYNKGRIVIDTLKTKKIIKGDTIKDIIINPTPVTVVNNNKEVLELLKDLKTNQEKIDALVKELQIRVYDTTYAFERGKFKVRDSVQGKLLSRDFSIFLDDIEYTENTIRETIKKYPKFSFSMGLNSGLSTDFNTFEKPFVGGVIGFKNRSGLQLDLSYNTLRQVQVELKKDIFVLYDKDKKTNK